MNLVHILKMAMPYITTSVIPKTQIEAIQSVTPYKVTDPREVLLVSAKEPIGSWIFRGTLNIVLLYNKGTEGDSGWHAAGWIKESLSRALKEQPMLSGRLRRGEDGHGDLEVVSNDSGVRLVEAKISISLQDFIDMEERESAEAQFVFWKDVDEQNPQFSPLFYVQVTNFQCGGYSIGISCSLVLADLLIMDNFLQKWANIQNDLIAKTNEPKLPLFYLPNLKPPSASLNSTFSSPTREKAGQTMVFKISSENVDLKENLALFCLEEAEKKLGTKDSSEFSFLVKETPQIIKIQHCKKNEIVKSQFKGEVANSSNLKDYLGMNEVAFRAGNKPAAVSYWIGSVNDGFVVAVPSPHKGSSSSDINIIVTFPDEHQFNSKQV